MYLPYTLLALNESLYTEKMNGKNTFRTKAYEKVYLFYFHFYNCVFRKQNSQCKSYLIWKY